MPETPSNRLGLSAAEKFCADCGESVLIGNERPEHVLPAAVNGRLTTRTVCDECNTLVGREIDQPWLDDVFVGHVRFKYGIPDRPVRMLDVDPFLAGATDDGRQVRVGHDGVPRVLNSVVIRDYEAGEIRITAKDDEELERLLEREAHKAAAEGRRFQPGEPRSGSDVPRIHARAEVEPGRWERMAAKVALGVLAKTQPAKWRSSPSARLLRSKMRDIDRPVDAVALRRADKIEAVKFVAPEPSTAAILMTLEGRVVALVSLLGVFALWFDLGNDLLGISLGWVSDPLRPSASMQGTFAEVVAVRIDVRVDG